MTGVQTCALPIWKGRDGMNAWRTLVLLAIRTGLNLDYDMLTEFAKNHAVIRKLMGVSLTENFNQIGRASCRERV